MHAVAYDPVAFVMHSVGPMAAETFPFICSVVGIASEQEGDHVGSALRIAIGTRKALVTAKHVIDEAHRSPLGAGVTYVRGEPPRRLDRPADLQDEQSDLAVYYLTDEEAPHSEGLAFWPEARSDANRTAREHDYLFVHGYPGARARFLFGSMQLRSLPYGVMERDDDLPVDTRSFEFAMDYDPSNMTLEAGGDASLVMPAGLSGSPVWRIGAYHRDPEAWTPKDALLVGLVTRWNPDHRVLLATEFAALQGLLQTA